MLTMPFLFKRAVFIFVCLLLAVPAVIAGGGPAGVVVVYDLNDPRSVTIANEYQQVRGVPERNMVPYAFPTTFSRTTAWDFVYSLRATLKARGLEPQLQSIALAGITPLNSAQTSVQYAVLSLHSFLYISPNHSEASSPVSSSQQNAYVNPANINGPAPNGTVAMTATSSFSGQRYWPVSSIGFPGKGGNSLREILGFIARAKARDGAKPTGGTIYWPLNTDVRSATRADQINDVKEVWQQRGIRYQVTNAENWVSNRPDIQGGIVGTEKFTDTGNSYMPGAWVDHLTSVGGSLDSFNPGQTPCSKWLRAGADGSSGTMSEPLANSSKFPHANIHTHLRAGASLVEAFWQSIELPSEIVCLGDPLLQPFADFPTVTLTAPANGASVSGNLAIAATAAPTGGKALEANLDLFIDGRRIAIGAAGETVLATRTAGGFTLNTATLPDGWHEVRVVAYNNDSVRTQGEAVTTILVNNAGQSISLTGPATVNPDSSATFTVTPVGFGDLTSLTLQANGRTLATLPTSGGSTNISGSLAPLANNWKVYAVGTRANGQQVWSAPLTTTVDWPVQAAATGVTPGGAMADVRFFNSTTASGFNWDTTTPDVATTFTGNATNGLYITPTNVTGITFNGTTAATLKPGYEVKCWIYAPADDWYEVGFGLREWNASVTSSCAIDGVTLPERNAVFGPRRLAPGWHALRLRLTVNNSAWTSWQVLLRGGSSQDFDIIRPSVSASMGTGVAASTPQILSITPSASPVTGTTATLTANATIGGGTPAERSGLTYHWSMVSGPSPVTFSANGTAGQPATTATFTQTGSYVIGLRVAGATDSAFATLPVTVQAGAPTMVLSTNSATTVLRGMPLNVWAYSKDQFGRRIDITPTVPGNRTVTWTSTDPNGSFQNISANGETAQFRSLSALTSNTTCKITATGTNGRTGSATSSNLTIATNASPTASSRPDLYSNFSSSSLFSIFQSGTTNALTFTATVSDPESDQTNSTYASPAYPGALLSYHWSVVSTPAGGALTLGADGFASISGAVSTPGAYSVRLDVTDQAGATASQTQLFYVDSVGSLTTSVALSDQTLHPGETPFYQQSFPHGAQTFQWQTSADGGASWQDVAGTTTSDGTYDYPTLNYGPVTAADNGRQFRLNLTKAGWTSTGLPGTITVVNYSGGIIRIVEAMSAGAGSYSGDSARISVPENVGSATFTVRRCGASSGAASVQWFLVNSSATRGVDYLAPDGTANGAYTGTLTWADGDNSDRLITVPIVNDTLAENTESFSLYLYSAVGTYIGPIGTGGEEQFSYYILDDDNAGQAAFRVDTATVTESAGSVTIPVSRSGSFVGSLTVNYATKSQTAVAGQDFTAISGALTWADGETADKQIVVPILSDNLVEGAETFLVTMNTQVGGFGSTPCTVTIKDAPYQQWQKAWWPSALPTLPLFNDYATALKSMSPMIQFRFSEASGTTVAGVDAAGVTVATGTLTKTGTGGNYTLAQAGPRPSLWPGLESGNTALAFTTNTTVTSTPPRYTAGASVNCGVANGLGSKLGGGFTIAMFVKTTVTDREMTLAGGKLTGTNPTTVSVSLNRAHNNSTACVPHAVRIYMAPQGINPASFSYNFSVALANTPTGSICDGQWHHLAITVPAFTTQTDSYKIDSPRFYFDGVETNAPDVRGSETIDATATFSNFSDTGFRIGADGSTTPISFFNGALDEFVFIPRVLTATEIANLVASRPPSTPPAHTADTGNPSGDGFPNLMKYALGLNPLTKASGADLPSIQPQTNNTVDFNFTRMRDATDIIYRVERRWDLMSGSWTEVYSSSGDPFGSTDPSMTESLNFDLQGNPKAFFRLKITRP